MCLNLRRQTQRSRELCNRIQVFQIMIRSATLGTTLLLFFAMSGCSASHNIETSESDWPSWRGPQGDGTSKDQKLPVAWGPDRNTVWKAAVPGTGYSTPIISGSRVFLSTAEDDA